MIKKSLAVGIATVGYNLDSLDASVNTHIALIEKAHEQNIDLLVFPANSLTSGLEGLAINSKDAIFDELSAAAGNMLVSIGFFEQMKTASIADLSLWQQESDEIFSHIEKSKTIKVLSQALIQNGNIVRLQREISSMQKTSLGEVHAFESGCRCGDHQVVTLVNQDLLNQDIMKPVLVSYGDVESTLIIAPSVDEISDNALKIAKQSVLNVYPTQYHFSNTLRAGYKASYSEGSNLNVKIISLAGDDASSLVVKAS